jgi:chorismate mutase / prephenate dehydratase
LSRRDPVDALRKKIDQLDIRIVGLLNQRATFAQKIGHIKNLGKRDIYVATRERAVLQQLSRVSPGPLPPKAIRAVYREILSACRSIEAPMTVAYLGPEATFTHMAARQQFGSSVKFLPVPTIAEVFNEVAQGRAHYGVVPIENSTEGVVTHTLDLLVESESGICAEVSIDIELHLLSRSGNAKDVTMSPVAGESLSQRDRRGSCQHSAGRQNRSVRPASGCGVESVGQGRLWSRAGARRYCGQRQ